MQRILRGDVPARRNVFIAGVAGDQQASLLQRAAIFQRGMVERECLWDGMLSADEHQHRDSTLPLGPLATVAWGHPGRAVYALEGSVFIAGAAIQWLRDEMNLIRNAAE